MTEQEKTKQQELAEREFPKTVVQECNGCGEWREMDLDVDASGIWYECRSCLYLNFAD